MSNDDVVSTALRKLAVAPAEAARLASVGRSTIYTAMKSGALPSIKVGKRRLIRLTALEAWLDSHGVGASADQDDGRC